MSGAFSRTLDDLSLHDRGTQCIRIYLCFAIAHSLALANFVIFFLVMGVRLWHARGNVIYDWQNEAFILLCVVIQGILLENEDSCCNPMTTMIYAQAGIVAIRFSPDEIIPEVHKGH